MSDIWVPVIAALGSSLLTGLVAFGLEWRRDRKAGQATQDERKARAYLKLLTRSGLILNLADNLHVAMQVRSGLKEGIAITLRLQKALDPLELSDRLRADLEPLFEAWSEIWVVGSKKAIHLANDLIEQCGIVVGAATQRGEARPELIRLIAGEKWTQEQLDQWQGEVRKLADMRRQFAVNARWEEGIEVTELFTGDESKDLSEI